jgi:DNA-directed RNA polymerase
MPVSIDDQIAREGIMAARGEGRSKTMIGKSLERGDAALTPAGMTLTKRGIEPLSTAIQAWLEQALAGNPSRRALSATLLKDVDADLAAFITIQAALNGASKRYTLKSTSLSLAERLECELIADKFEAENQPLYRAIIRNATARGLSPERQAKAVTLANRKFEVVTDLWTTSQRLHVGAKLIELMIESMGLVQCKLLRRGKKNIPRLQLAEDLDPWFQRYNEASTLTRPLFLPTVVPPRPWSTPYDGAYYTPVMGRAKIISRSFPGQIEQLAKADMRTVYAGVNALQETPWRVNKRVLAVMKQAWEMDARLPCLPRREDDPIPVAPQEVADAEKGSDVRKAWRNKVRAIHERNSAGRAQRFELARALTIATENADLPAIYFPHRLDFRGRAYAASTSLNPQGSDEVRGLLEFAEGKPLGERGLFWLGVHGANLYGNDKVSLDDRYLWAEEQVEKAWAVAEDPLSQLWWTEADKPWCFLAWCFEWADVWPRPNKERFISHLPIALDGSCNGIQHFSAMLRDPIGGAAVNLTPSPKPNDIYGRVADRVIERLKARVEDNEFPCWMAEAWLAFGINRKLTKRAVMVLPYGGTYKSCVDYVREAVREQIAGGKENPFGGELMKAEQMLAGLVWAAISDVVVAARAAMGWLQQVARVATKAGVPLRWTTPSGFVVVQHYRELKGKRVETRFNGSVLKFRSTEEKDVIDRQRQVSAVSPNFVHSLDAAAMMRTICIAKEDGINSFAMIHDSYGTHAAETDRLAERLRIAFVQMYLETDVLQAFRDEIAEQLPEEFREELPAVPEMGTLDLKQVLDSPYFFA